MNHEEYNYLVYIEKKVETLVKIGRGKKTRCKEHIKYGWVLYNNVIVNDSRICENDLKKYFLEKFGNPYNGREWFIVNDLNEAKNYFDIIIEKHSVENKLDKVFPSWGNERMVNEIFKKSNIIINNKLETEQFILNLLINQWYENNIIYDSNEKKNKDIFYEDFIKYFNENLKNKIMKDLPSYKSIIKNFMIEKQAEYGAEWGNGLKNNTKNSPLFTFRIIKDGDEKDTGINIKNIETSEKNKGIIQLIPDKDGNIVGFVKKKHHGKMMINSNKKINDLKDKIDESQITIKELSETNEILKRFLD